MLVASKLSGVTGALVVETIELHKWLILFGCALEELRFIIVDLADWISNYYLPGLHIFHYWHAAYSLGIVENQEGKMVLWSAHILGDVIVRTMLLYWRREICHGRLGVMLMLLGKM